MEHQAPFSNFNNEPLCSILIVNYNGKRFLKALFESIRQTKYSNFEVIFADNGSSDGSADFVEKFFP